MEAGVAPAAGGLARASGLVSSAVGSVTGATVTSVTPGACATTGTVTGIDALGLVMVGAPVFAALLTSGPWRSIPLACCINVGLV